MRCEGVEGPGVVSRGWGGVESIGGQVDGAGVILRAWESCEGHWGQAERGGVMPGGAGFEGVCCSLRGRSGRLEGFWQQPTRPWSTQATLDTSHRKAVTMDTLLALDVPGKTFLWSPHSDFEVSEKGGKGGVLLLPILRFKRRVVWPGGGGAQVLTDTSPVPEQEQESAKCRWRVGRL